MRSFVSFTASSTISEKHSCRDPHFGGGASPASSAAACASAAVGSGSAAGSAAASAAVVGGGGSAAGGGSAVGAGSTAAAASPGNAVRETSRADVPPPSAGGGVTPSAVPAVGAGVAVSPSVGAGVAVSPSVGAGVAVSPAPPAPSVSKSIVVFTSNPGGPSGFPTSSLVFSEILFACSFELTGFAFSGPVMAVMRRRNAAVGSPSPNTSFPTNVAPAPNAFTPSFAAPPIFRAAYPPTAPTVLPTTAPTLPVAPISFPSSPFCSLPLVSPTEWKYCSGFSSNEDRV